MLLSGALIGGLVILVAGAIAYHYGRDPMGLPVDADTPQDLQAWMLNTETRMTLAQKRQFDAALAEIRLREMGTNNVSGATFIEEALCADIDGRPAREVVREGLSWKATRLGAELEQLMSSRARNQRLRTKPGDTASRAYLDEFDARMADRIDQCHQALRETQEALASDSG